MDLINWHHTQKLPSQGVDLIMSLDDSFIEMTYTDTSTKEDYNRTHAIERDNLAVFNDKHQSPRHQHQSPRHLPTSTTRHQHQSPRHLPTSTTRHPHTPPRLQPSSKL
ncbi:uncharacterized protein LOC121855171 [Homarus americanus]|uniref:uncharacterized protein LOC121855171 n=1 Tax=Homarus americanus TaxID=6706 RepID=UPI001C47E12E|nr:uncharacterized protein LOC121855171 [Homarus americanus]